eukprot:TRINITY_DN36372_c0_g1_i2.p1 TRINITY_DN36372_c0_g1~~TRINITY_DN36372_c0_g1_i2.p1  ORF type:complete len:620 (-),score=71.41 TRINITY_DN36372_c0_g1_i2:474-2333(-)
MGRGRRQSECPGCHTLRWSSAFRGPECVVCTATRHNHTHAHLLQLTGVSDGALVQWITAYLNPHAECVLALSAASRALAGVEDLPLQLPSGSQLLRKRPAGQRFKPIGAIVYEPAGSTPPGPVLTSLRVLGPQLLLELDLRLLTRVREWGVLTDICELAQCANLHTLRLPFPVDLSPLVKLPQLKHISVEQSFYSCRHSTPSPYLASLASLGQIYSLEMNVCTGLEDIGPLTSALKELRLLRLRQAPITALPPKMLSLAHLVHLDLGIDVKHDWSWSPSPVFVLEGLVQLTHLNLSGRDLSNTEQVFSQLPRCLDTLVLLDCVGFDSLDGCPRSLRVLNAAHTASCITRDDSLAEGRQLEGVIDPMWLVDVSALAECPQLSWLDLSGRTRVKHLACLAKCTALQEVRLTHCFGVSDLSPLALLPALELVHLTWFGGGAGAQLDVSCLAGSFAHVHFGFFTDSSQLTQLAPRRVERQSMDFGAAAYALPTKLHGDVFLDYGCDDYYWSDDYWYDDDYRIPEWNCKKLTRELRKAARGFVKEHLPTHHVSRPAEFTIERGGPEFVWFEVSRQTEVTSESSELLLPVVAAGGESEDTEEYECELCGFKGSFDAATTCEASHC